MARALEAWLLPLLMAQSFDHPNPGRSLFEGDVRAWRSNIDLFLDDPRTLASFKGGASDWHGRSIYFIMTDKFAKSASSQSTESTLCGGSDWCNGTLIGIIDHLDYIAGMGFDAIWITPVVEQVDEDTGVYNGSRWRTKGSHGYWAKNLYEIEPHIGNSKDLRRLSDECHRRGMFLMVDVVANHMGPLHNGSLATMVPFNSADSFHTLHKPPEMTFADYLQHPCNALDSCYPGNFACPGFNQTVKEMCWFYDLGDLNHENAAVATTLNRWVHDLVVNYSLDGLRLDTAAFVPQSFLREFQKSAGVYIVGEVTTFNMSFHKSYQDVLQGVLNFPSYYYMACAFGNLDMCKLGSIPENSFQPLADVWHQYEVLAYRDVDLLGNFVDNHDMPRFLRSLNDTALLKSALTVVMFQRGIPIVYYGTEQSFDQDDERTVLWPHYNTSSPMYIYITKLNALRRVHVTGDRGKTQAVLRADHRVFAFSRGNLVILVTNIGQDAEPVQACVPQTSLPWDWRLRPTNLLTSSQPYVEGDSLCVNLEEGLPAILSGERQRYVLSV